VLDSGPFAGRHAALTQPIMKIVTIVGLALGSLACSRASTQLPAASSQALIAAPSARLPPKANSSRPSSSAPVGRVLAGAGLGLLGGFAGFALGFYTAAPLAAAAADNEACGDVCGLDSLGWGLVGGATLAVAGVSLGTYAGSEWAGGDGSLGWTVLGGVGGSALAVALGVLEVRTHDPGPLLAGTLVVLPILGTALGYELSAVGRSQGQGSATLAVAAAPGGAELAVSGRF
jgi:hypothetical protein